MAFFHERNLHVDVKRLLPLRKKTFLFIKRALKYFFTFFQHYNFFFPIAIASLKHLQILSFHFVFRRRQKNVLFCMATGMEWIRIKKKMMSMGYIWMNFHPLSCAPSTCFFCHLFASLEKYEKEILVHIYTIKFSHDIFFTFFLLKIGWLDEKRAEYLCPFIKKNPGFLFKNRTI